MNGLYLTKEGYTIELTSIYVDTKHDVEYQLKLDYYFYLVHGQIKATNIIVKEKI